MDDLRQIFEIKMASGEMANEITFTKDRSRGRQDPDFFLALVGGLEDKDVPLSVRFIFDPLRTLSQQITGNVTLSRDYERSRHSNTRSISRRSGRVVTAETRINP